MIELHCGDCLDILPALESGSVDAVICDPPYPEISRDYGRMTEEEWHAMMHALVPKIRRVLKPTGSAMFVLQPNSKTIGTMRPWLWKFMVYLSEEWNIVQDAYWWNIAALPVGGAITDGLLRGSLKYCVWAGSPNCYRKQEAVLWTESLRNTQERLVVRAGKQYYPSGRSVDRVNATGAATRRGGVTPFNVLPLPNSDPYTSAGSHGHGAGTPQPLADWWTRYLVPDGGTALDPFMGSGTMGLSAYKYGASFIGIERDPVHFATAQKRIAQVQMQPMLELTG